MSDKKCTGSVDNVRHVLVLYTGGTIGMIRSQEGVYGHTAGGNTLCEELRERSPTLHDRDYPIASIDKECSTLALPDTGQPNRVVYTIYEYETLIDSSNMTVDHWIRLATDIYHFYHHFDGFVILQGTDTMAYTASALSFMFEHLAKPVVITGAMLSLFEVRSDGRHNLLNALIIAGNYNLGEVVIVFRDKLLRGNRASKVSSTHLAAFDSPNMPVLGTLGLSIDINWSLALGHNPDKPFEAHFALNRNVALLRFYPFLTVHTIRSILQPNIQGLVLLTYGTGNAPSGQPDILKELKEANERGVILVNISQCFFGRVSYQYETGQALRDVGVVCGADMTVAAGLTKLSYVLSKDELNIEQKKLFIASNIRGELTESGDS